jgi:hypothetical protein
MLGMGLNTTPWFSARWSGKSLQDEPILMEEAECNHLLNNSHSKARMGAVLSCVTCPRAIAARLRMATGNVVENTGRQSFGGPEYGISVICAFGRFFQVLFSRD